VIEEKGHKFLVTISLESIKRILFITWRNLGLEHIHGHHVDQHHLQHSNNMFSLKVCGQGKIISIKG
jgi:hypothetical protein